MEKRERTEADLFIGLYAELREVAGRLLRRERGEAVLQPTALVHEAWLRYAGSEIEREKLLTEREILGLGTKLMRQALIDYARRRSARKRNGDSLKPVELESVPAARFTHAVEAVELRDTLDYFETIDPRKAQVFELRVFLGLTIPEIAKVLKISVRTANSDWYGARAWFRQHLEKQSAAAS